MTDAPDAVLLEQFARNGSEAAFAALVQRYIALVHSVALRHTANPQQAQDITQAVFIILARKAGALGRKTVLPGWLYHTARLTAANWQRAESRRVRREQEVFMQSKLEESATDALWRELSPQLDEAMASLGTSERDALVLRYFQNKSMAEVGKFLGLEENTAQKRVSRALEKLRKFFTKRGVNSTTAILAGAISANSVQVVPVALAKSITAVAITKGAAVSGSTLTLIQGALKIMAWTKAKTAVVAVTAVILATGTTTVVIKTGAFGIEHGKSPRPRETMAKSNKSPRIFSNGINNAHRIPNSLYTYPSGDETTHRYLEAVVKRFRKELNPARVIKSDRELSEADIQSQTIYIYGSPENHSFFRRVREQLPLVFEDDGIVVGKTKCVGRDVGAIFVCPNPLNPKNRLIIYGAVSPEALQDMNAVFHGPTDYIIFNNATRQFTGADASDCFLLLGAFDKSDPARWRVDEELQLLPPKDLQRATSRVVVAR
jgi:RNA polymerase sigma factor (sigma-70 family)